MFKLLLIVLLPLTLEFLNSVNGSIKIHEGYLGESIYSFVHGGLESKLNFTEAEHHCLNLIKTENNSESHLASIQNSKDAELIQNWILNLERKSYWIGGEIICSINALLEKMHLLHWINDDKVIHTNFKVPNVNVQQMNPGEKLCVSVDHVDERWGAHHCGEKKYFLCVTRKQTPEK